MKNTPVLQLLEDVHYLLKTKGSHFELVCSQEFALAKQRAMRKLTREKVDQVLDDFLNLIKE